MAVRLVRDLCVERDRLREERDRLREDLSLRDRMLDFEAADRRILERRVEDLERDLTRVRERNFGWTLGGGPGVDPFSADRLRAFVGATWGWRVP